jgi:hypothetical protein
MLVCTPCAWFCNMRMIWSCILRENMLRLLGSALPRLMTWFGLALSVEYIQRRCHARVHFMKSIAGQSWGAHPAGIVVLYKNTVRSVIEYGEVCFFGMAACHMRRLERIQWRAGRICFGLIRSTHVTCAVCGGSSRSPSDKTEAFIFKTRGFWFRL